MSKLKINTHYNDVTIVGAGGAGLMAAVYAARSGLSVACVSKVDPTRSHTVAAKGGINAALGNVTEDNWQWHMYDTIHGGDWICDYDAVEYMCKNAPATIIELEQMGVPFSRDENGRIFQRTYGGQSSKFGTGIAPERACAVADRTGHAILHTLYQQALKNNTRFYTDHFTMSLIMDDGVCRGVISWDIASGEINIFRSHMVILATGGYGQLYKTSTSSTICTGDGNAMALRAGLPLQDMEFVQFHPTGLAHSGFLLSEAARSEGAYLINGNGERFMERYAPSYKDMAARDVIARAMATEIKEGRGAGANKDYLLLCLNHLTEETIMKKLPSVYETSMTFARKNPVKEPIPVMPSAHYTMGGIPTASDCAVIDKNGNKVEGLMAVGEAACLSVHGANRIGCNSLLDIIVFGKAAALNAAKIVTPSAANKVLNGAEEWAVSHINNILERKTGSNFYVLRNELKSTMSEYAGVFRTGETLNIGIKKAEAIKQQIGEAVIAEKSLIWNNDLLELLELENLALQGMATLISAEKRQESRGSHMREDFPHRDDKNFLKHAIVTLQNGHISHATRNISTKVAEADLQFFKPEKRQY